MLLKAKRCASRNAAGKEAKAARKAQNSAVQKKREQTKLRVQKFRSQKAAQAWKQYENAVFAAKHRQRGGCELCPELQSGMAFTLAKLCAALQWREGGELSKNLECGYLEPNGAFVEWQTGRIVEMWPIRGELNVEPNPGSQRTAVGSGQLNFKPNPADNSRWALFEAHDARGRKRKPMKKSKLPRFVAVPVEMVVPLTDDMPRSDDGLPKFSAWNAALFRLAGKLARERAAVKHRRRSDNGG